MKGHFSQLVRISVVWTVFHLLTDWMSWLCRAELLSSGLCVFVGGEPEPCRNSLTTRGLSVCFHRAQTSGRLTARRHWASVSNMEMILCPLLLPHTPGWTGRVYIELYETKSVVCVFACGNCFTLFSTGFTVSVFLPVSLEVGKRFSC